MNNEQVDTMVPKYPIFFFNLGTGLALESVLRKKSGLSNQF